MSLADQKFCRSGGGIYLCSQRAIPYDIPGAEYSHEGEYCTFDYIVKKHHLDEPALQQMAVIVRGADTDRFDLAPQAAGLWAISAGLAYNVKDDKEQLAFWGKTL